MHRGSAGVDEGRCWVRKDVLGGVCQEGDFEDQLPLLCYRFDDLNT